MDPEELNTILVCDDEPELVEILSDDLRELGYEVITASSGEEAYRILEERRSRMGDCQVKVIVSDWMMPHGDGMQLLNKIRSGPHAHTPFVLMSGAVTRQQLDSAISFDADSVLLKPFNVKSLTQQIGEAIARRHEKK